MYLEEKSNLECAIQFKEFANRYGKMVDKSYALGRPEDLINCQLYKTDNSISFMECFTLLMHECYPFKVGGGIQETKRINFKKSGMLLHEYAKELGKILWLDLDEINEIRDWSYFTQDQKEQLLKAIK